MAIILLETLRHNGKRYQAGEKLSLNEEAEKRLVSIGSAEYEKELKDLDEPDEIKVDEETYQKYFDEINSRFNKEPLAKLADKHEVIIKKDNPKKDEIIDAIIRQGKAEDVLSEEE